jgi:N-acetylglucosamine kinase-like BadF-type ATPase
VSARRAAVVAVDGGNSKTDLALVSRRGDLLALVRGPTVSHQQVPIEQGMTRLRKLHERALADAGIPAGSLIGSFCLAGADFAPDVALLRRAIAATGVAEHVIVRNDAFAAIRAGAPSGWGIGVVCGAGVNAVGVRPDGRTARLAAIGDLSGDWGGGYGVAMAALGAAVRDRDGRGPATVLSSVVPAAFGLRRPIDVSRGIYEGRIDRRRLEDLAPLVFEAADGDSVARAIVDRLADELGTMAIAIGRRLRLARATVDVVLTGGVVRTRDAPFHRRLRDRIADGLPHARVTRLEAPPVLGAALLGLDALGSPTDAAAERLLRAAIIQRSGA